MTFTEDIIGIFESKEFQQDLEELSSYAANIRQERPIVHLFAKHLLRKGKHKVALEARYDSEKKDKCDLKVNGKILEFKSHLDSDLRTVEKDLENCHGDLREMWRRIVVDKKNKTWCVCPGIYKDIIEKKPDYFAWIICSRDLSAHAIENTQIVVIADHYRYRLLKPFDPAGEHLETAETLLNKIHAIRKFKLNRATVLTKGIFPSAYHLFLSDFTI